MVKQQNKKQKTMPENAVSSTASVNVNDVVSAITALMGKLDSEQLKAVKSVLRVQSKAVSVPSIKDLQNNTEIAALPVPKFEDLTALGVNEAEGNTFAVNRVYYSSQFSRRTGKPYTSIQLYGTVSEGKLKRGQRFRILCFLSSFNGKSPLDGAKPIAKTTKGYGYMYSTDCKVTVKNGKVIVLESGQ